MLFLNGKNLGHQTCLQGLLCYTHEPNAGDGGRDPVESHVTFDVKTERLLIVGRVLLVPGKLMLVDCGSWMLSLLFLALASEGFVVAIVAVGHIE